MKKFNEYVNSKERVDNYTHNPTIITEDDLYWCAIGENKGEGLPRRYGEPHLFFTSMRHKNLYGNSALLR